MTAGPEQQQQEGSGGQHRFATSKDEDDFQPVISSPTSGRIRRSRDVDDIEDHNAIQHQRSNAPTASVWISETMSLPQEILFVATICLTQFCNREFGPGRFCPSPPYHPRPSSFSQILTVSLAEASYCFMLFLLDTVGQSLEVQDASLLSWLVAGFSLTAGTFLIFSGRLGDAFGYKLMLMIGFSWFALWSVAAGLAVFSGYTLFVFARVLQGVGSAVCIPNALALLGAAYPPGHRKAMVFALFGAGAPVGALAGGICGVALGLLWWPWAFWALAITQATLAVVTYFIVPSRPGKLAGHCTVRNLVVELDLLGGVTGVSALILFNFAWNQAPISGWDTAEVIVTLLLGLGLLLVFLWIEYRHAEYPLLPLDAFNSDVGFVLGAVACGWSMFGIWSLYIVQVLENIRGLAPLLAAAWLLPVLVCGLIASVFTGFLLGPAKFRPATVMTMALVMFTAGILIFTTAPVDQIYWAQTFVSICVIPFGMDMSFPAATLILSNAVKKEHQGIAASLVATVVNYSTSLGVGFAGTVEVHVNNGGKTQADLLKGYRGALYMGIGLAAFGLVICLIFLAKDRGRTSRKSLTGKEKSNMSP